MYANEYVLNLYFKYIDRYSWREEDRIMNVNFPALDNCIDDVLVWFLISNIIKERTH